MPRESFPRKPFDALRLLMACGAMVEKRGVTFRPGTSNGPEPVEGRCVGLYSETSLGCALRRLF